MDHTNNLQKYTSSDTSISPPSLKIESWDLSIRIPRFSWEFNQDRACWHQPVQVLLVPIIFDDKTREIYWGFCWEYWLVKCKFYKFWQVNACPGRCSLGQEQWVMDRRIWSLEKRNNVCFKRLNASGEKTKFKAHTTKCQATDRFPSFPTTWWFPKLAHIETLANLK